MTALLDRLASLSPERRQVVVRQLDPLSFIQERLWFLHQLAPDLPVYNIPLPLLLAGPINVPTLSQSLGVIAERHEILRTTFPNIDGQAVQHVAYRADVQVPIVDLGDVPPPRQDAVRQRALDAEVQRVCDVERGPLWRALIVRLAHDRHVLLLTWHHLVYDGWSRSIVLAELAATYARLAAGLPPALDPLPVQYRHFARAQRTRLQGRQADAQMAYWREHLAGELPSLDLPSTRPRPLRPTYRGADEMFALEPEAVAALRAIGRDDGVTLFMTLLTGWVLLLQKYCGVRDLIVGTVSSGRARPELERLIGCFVNTLALRVSLTGTPTVRQVLGQVREVALGAYANQDVPFDKLVAEFHPERRVDETPLFRTWLTLENTPTGGPGHGGHSRLVVEEVTASDRTAKFDLSLTVKENAAGVLGPLRYARDLFDRPTIVRLIGHLRQVLRGMAARPDAPVSTLSLLTEAERAQILGDWNGGTQPHGEAADLLVPAFEAQAARTPDAIALAWQSTRISYGELNRRANCLARELRGAGVETETLVAVCLERTPELVTALLAVLKAGGGYVPLDPRFPPARLALILDETSPRAVLTVRALESRLPTVSAPVLCLDARSRVPTDLDRVDPPQAAASSNVAYAIYTSGSTGRPKGVVIQHGSLREFLIAMDRVLGRVDDGVWMATTSPAFDISVLELLWTLTRGMTIALQTSEPIVRAAPARPRRLHTAFSLFYFASDAEDHPGPERYRLLLDGARFADAHGFSSVWMPERHFHSFGGIYPNPSVTAAAVAAVTTRVQIRAGSVVLPLHDPIRVAEEWAVVDNLSNGRTGISFASGWHANDFVLAPDRYASRRQAMVEMIDVVRRLWRGETIVRQGPAGTDVDIRIRPRPVQPELPVWITSGGAPDTFRQAGAIGANLLTHLLGQTVEELSAKIAIYREAWRTAGHGPGDGHVTLMLHTFLSADSDAVREIVRGPFSAYLRDSVSLLSELARGAGKGTTVDTLAPEDLDALVAHAFTRYFGSSGLFGTPESAMAIVQRLQEAGVDEIGCLIDFGIESGDVLAGLKHLAALQELVRADAARAEEEVASVEVMRSRGVTHLQCTPTWARLLMLDAEAPAALAGLSALLVGGEALPAPLAADLCACGPGQLHNMYGPTETTIWSSSDRVGEPEHITIGRPFLNTQIYVVDRDAQLSPQGIPGEVWIGGAGVTRGYWLRPDLTAARFVPDPFGPASGARLYRTGDRGRWTADGRLEFLGRVDHQVKLRGRRLELSEIEAVLRAQPGVRDTVVVVREDRGTEPRLVAYVESATAVTADALQERLRDHLPDYMVPSAIIVLDALPMTSSGKVDRRALPAPSEERPALTDRYVAPRTPVEAALTRIWADVLRLDRVGIHDNFFALGGDSILSLQIVARAVQAGWRLVPRHLFEHQTVAALGQVAQAASGVAPVEQTVVGPVPLLPIQSWFFELPRPAAHHYNQQVLLEVDPSIVSVLGGAWSAVLAHHDALRLRFTATSSGWIQVGSRAKGPAPIETVDLRAVGPDAQLRLWHTVAASVQASLNLEHGPVARLVLFIPASGTPHVFIVAHHLVVDGVSWRVILADLAEGARQLSAGKTAVLPPKTGSVRQWADALRALASSETLAREIDLWTRMSEPAAKLPHAVAGERNLVRAARTHVSALNKDETLALLRELPGRGVGQVQELLLTALVHALAEWTGEQAWRVDLEGHGRELPEGGEIDASRTVGWFTTLYPVRLSAGRHPFDTLRAVKSTMRTVPHGGLGYGVMRYLDGRPETLAVRTGLRADIIFNYLGQFDQVLEREGPMRPAGMPVGPARAPNQPREYGLEINSLVRGGHLQIAWTCGESGDGRETLEISGLAERFAATARALIAASRESGAARPWLVAADVPLARITDEELGQLAASGPIADVYPLSPMQQGLLFHSLYGADRSPLYTIQFHSRVEEGLDVELFALAWQDVIARHAALRTGFVWERTGRPLQTVYETVETPCIVEDWRGVPAVEQEARCASYIQAEQRRGFDLDRPPLMRVALLRLAERAWHIVWTAHHLVVDGWSVPLVMGEVLRTYQARVAGRAAEAAPAGQFSDYIAWVERQDLAKSEAFWRRTLDGFTSPSLIATADRSGSHQTFSTHVLGAVLPAPVAERLQALGRAHALTLNTWLVGAWALLLAHVTRTRDVVFGTVVSGRPAHLPDVERTIGAFANTLPMRVTIAAADPLLTWLARIQRQQTDAREFEHTPLGSVQGWSGVPPGRPLFDSLFLYENFPADPILDRSGEASDGSKEAAGAGVPRSSVVIPTTFPLVLQVDPSRGTIELEVVVDPAAIPVDEASEMLELLQHIVQRIASEPDATVGVFMAALADAARERRVQARERVRERNRGRLRRLQRT